ncbi:MAG: hypothetical protein JWM68_1454 [Verrucomicrobiales bacterium]|nr:hypothetical protein [Verrucomicrobiales bacterium]
MGSAPQYWPSDAPISRASDRATLMLFAHPKCPCTRATVEELNRLLARCSHPVATRVFFLKPANAPKDWTETGLWRSAAAIPGVEVKEDPEGKFASQFGASTSGSVLLYDAKGRLLFKGGITSSRGHAGDNVGSDTIVSLLDGNDNGLKQTPVFGCSLITSVPTNRNSYAVSSGSISNPNK